MNRRGFTLIELLVVIAIIVTVSALAIKMLIWSSLDWQMTASIQQIRAAAELARGAARRDGISHGFRLQSSTPPHSEFDANGNPVWVVPDLLDTILPLSIPPAYSEGLVTMLSPPYPGGFVPPFPCLVLSQSVTDANGNLASPTGWFYNVRLGDRIELGKHIYTVCGPMTIPNADGFVNIGPPETISPLGAEYLFLVNGRDDNGDGLIDNGWDGMVHGLNGDAFAVWENEAWTNSVPPASPYSIIRRPIPNTQQISHLSIPISVSASTLYTSPIGGSIDIMFRPSGTVDLMGPFSVPSAIGFSQASSVFTLQDPYGNTSQLTLWTKNGALEEN